MLLYILSLSKPECWLSWSFEKLKKKLLTGSTQITVVKAPKVDTIEPDILSFMFLVFSMLSNKTKKDKADGKKYSFFRDWWM